MSISPRDVMRGSPPPPEHRVTLANWRLRPFSQWAYHRVRDIIPTAAVWREDGAPAFDATPRPIGRWTFTGADGESWSVERMLEATWTDAMVVLHRGRVVFETYRHGMRREVPHILFSVTKSVTALLAGVAADRGLLDPDAAVTDHVPEAAGSAYEGATVRHLLDMQVGVDFDEVYDDEPPRMVEYRRAMGWVPDDGTGGDLRSFVVSLPGKGAHGERFAYVSPNTDLLGWTIERAAARPLPELLTEWLWRPMGAEHDAYVTVDRNGAPRAAGGLCASARDLARIGQLLLDGGHAGGREVIPAWWVDDILSRGDEGAWDRGDFEVDLPDFVYRSQWYRRRGALGPVMGLGVYGQTVYADPVAEMVIAKFSSQPLGVDPALEYLQRLGFEAIAARLAAG